MCAKQAKKTQTDYTKGGKRISDTAIPLYEKGLNQLSEWTLDPTRQIDTYLDKYYGKTAAQSDAIRDYERAMGNTASNLYATTHGGYSSAGDMSAANQQRAWNDYMARLRDQGVQNAYNMYSGSVGQLQNSLGAYDTAYGKGKEYSDIEQYNYIADQANSAQNQIGGSLGAVGTAIGSIWGPAGAMIGGAIGNGIGGQMKIDTDSAFRSLGSGTSGGQYGGQSNNSWTGLQLGLQNLSNSGKLPWTNLFGGNKDNG